MDILIRNIDANIVKQIDKMAAQTGVSRNEYLVKYLSNLTVLDELRLQEQKYSHLVKSMGDVVAHNTNELKQIRELLNSLEIYHEGE